ncbi:MAG: family 2A encapsulin nanocompartment cargo protein cysteine desulfurase [Caldilineaceae bacterium]
MPSPSCKTLRWINTMTTPNLGAQPAPQVNVTDLTRSATGGHAALADALEASAVQASGAPAPELIAQLANQFFAALPGQPPPSVARYSSPVLAPAAPAGATALPAVALATPPPPPVLNQIALPGPEGIQPGPATPSLTQPPTTPAPPTLGTAADLSALPVTFSSVMAFTRALPARATAHGVAPASLPAGSLYFIEEALATRGTDNVPFHLEKLTFRPESVTYDPGRVPDIGLGVRPFDPYAIRRDFPILQEQVHGKRLVWLDNSATTQKPQAVIDRLTYFYEHENSNVHRAAHALAARATDAYEAAREKVRRFLNAASPQEIIFVRGATEAINLVAQSWGRQNISKDDEIVITWLEHHANIVPWQQLAAEKGARLRVAPVDDSGQVILAEYEKLLGSRTKLVAITQVSNALGTITPVPEMVAAAHRHGALTLVDGAQAVAHMRQDVQASDTDFYIFSGHKIFGPTGIGVVYGKKAVLDHTPPWQGGGNMIADVTFERTLYQPPPTRFEAGTGNIADAVGLGAALDYVTSLGLENIGRYEHDLLQYATAGLKTVPGLRIIGTAQEKAGVLSFVLVNTRTEDIGAALDKEGIAVRAGHHCAQPILRRFGVESTVRASLAPYNTCEDIDALVAALLRIQRHAATV